MNYINPNIISNQIIYSDSIASNIKAPLDVLPNVITSIVLDYCASSICTQAANQLAINSWYESLKKEIKINIRSITQEINCSSDESNAQLFCLEVANKIRKFAEYSGDCILKEQISSFADFDLLPIISQIQQTIDSDLCNIFEKISGEVNNKELKHLFTIKMDNKDRANFIRKWIIDENRNEDLKKIKHLDLEDYNLHTLPYEIGALKELKQLDLSFNHIQQIPISFCNLIHLERLDLSRNNLKKIPKFFGQFNQLELVYLSFNDLQEVPDFLAHLNNLTYLKLDCTGLKNIPHFICELPMLKYLSLRMNHLEQLPESIGQLSQLSFLRLDGNKLITFPLSFQKLLNQGCEIVINPPQANIEFKKDREKQKKVCIVC